MKLSYVRKVGVSEKGILHIRVCAHMFFQTFIQSNSIPLHSNIYSHRRNSFRQRKVKKEEKNYSII